MKSLDFKLTLGYDRYEQEEEKLSAFYLLKIILLGYPIAVIMYCSGTIYKYDENAGNVKIYGVNVLGFYIALTKIFIKETTE